MRCWEDIPWLLRGGASIAKGVSEGSPRTSRMWCLTPFGGLGRGPCACLLFWARSVTHLRTPQALSSLNS